MCILIFKPRKVYMKHLKDMGVSLFLLKTCFYLFTCLSFAHVVQKIYDSLRTITGNMLKCEKINIFLCELWRNYLI